MTRWIRTGALALALGLPGTGFAQTAPPAAKTAAGTGQPQVGELLTFRTSGQPERQVRILRIVGTPEADGLADVQDLGTGAKYSVPLKIVAMMSRTSPPTTAAPAARPATASGPGLPSVTRTLPNNPQPTAPRPAPPPPQRLLPSEPDPAPTSPPPARVRETPTPTSPPPAPRPAPTPADDLTPKFRAVVPTVAVEVTPPKPVVNVEPTPAPDPTPAAPAVTFTPRRTPDVTPVLPAIPDVVVTKLTPVNVPEGKPAGSPPAAAAAAPSPVAAAAVTPPELEKPVRMLPPPPAANPGAVVAPPTLVEPPKYVVVPVAEYAPEPPPAPVKDVVVVRQAAAPPAPAPAASPEVIARFGPPPVVPLAEPRTGELATAATPPRMLPPPPASPVQYTAPTQYTPPAPAPEQLTDRLSAPTPAPEPSRTRPELPAQMMEEVQPFVNELFQSLRPSLRERAATGLAEGRYASRPEVKATLARAAQIDPAADVKAHCINLLSALGYHEAGYLTFLGACAESGEPAVKQAARAAINKLARR